MAAFDGIHHHSEDQHHAGTTTKEDTKGKDDYLDDHEGEAHAEEVGSRRGAAVLSEGLEGPYHAHNEPSEPQEIQDSIDYVQRRSTWHPVICVSL